MKQEERRRNTRRLLLDTTIALIAEKGCHLLTMQDIANAAGLSKGAIFHYVRSKDEMFVWVLQEQLEQTNNRFLDEVASGRRTFAEPMKAIADSISSYGESGNVTNKVLLYLLGKEDQPFIAEAVRDYYKKSVQLSQSWIETGQQYGVIPPSVDAAKTADMFVLLTFGMRMRASIPFDGPAFTGTDFTTFITSILQPGQVKNEKEASQ